MKKKLIRLTESDLHKIIKESVRNVLNEMDDFSYDINTYRDIGTTSGLKGFNKIFDKYKEIKRILSNYNNSKDDRKDWDLLHMCDWYKFFNTIHSLPRDMRFKTGDENVTSEDYSKIEEFVKSSDNIPYPNLSSYSNSSFVDKSKDIIDKLKYAYRVYSDFIDYFLSKHESGYMKDSDIDADWKMFDKTRQEFLDKTKHEADFDGFERSMKDYGFKKNLKNPLRRYDIVSNPNDEKNQRYHERITDF